MAAATMRTTTAYPISRLAGLFMVCLSLVILG